MRGAIAERTDVAAALSVITHRRRPRHNADWAMNYRTETTKTVAKPRWDTSSSNDDPLTLPPSFESLDGHAQECMTANGTWFDLLRRFDGVRAFVAPRPISVAVAILAPTMMALWLWPPFSSI